MTNQQRQQTKQLSAAVGMCWHAKVLTLRCSATRCCMGHAAPCQWRCCCSGVQLSHCLPCGSCMMHACMHVYDVHAADGQQRCFPRHWVRQQTQSHWQASIAAAGWRAPRNSLVLVSQVSPGASSEAAGKHATTAETQQQQHAQP
jgi:hypothetical protein